MLGRRWRKGSRQALLVGVEIQAATMEDSMEVPQKINNRTTIWGFLGGAVVENLPANAGDTGSSPGLGRSHMLRSN